MPIINGITFRERPDSCRLTGGQVNPLVGTRILDCAWNDREDAVTALMGKIVITRDSAGNETRQTLFPPDTFPGWDNLEASDFSMEGVGPPSEDADGGAAYTWARFTVTYKVLFASDTSSSDGDSNAGQFYDTEQLDYESSFITIPGGAFTIGGEKALDMTAIPCTIVTHTFTKRDMASLPDNLSTWIDTVNDAQFPPETGAPAGCLRFAGAKATKKVNAAGAVRYDVQYVFKERFHSWNQAIKPSDGTWGDIDPDIFTPADYTQIAGL